MVTDDAILALLVSVSPILDNVLLPLEVASDIWIHQTISHNRSIFYFSVDISQLYEWINYSTEFNLYKVITWIAARFAEEKTLLGFNWSKVDT